MFVENYVHSLNSSDLRDDHHHHSTEALKASACADKGAGAVLGSLLCRVKFASGAQQTFESGTDEMAQLLRAWEGEVVKRGQERKWVRTNTAWDMQAAFKLYKRVAHLSLAHWLNPNCPICRGAKVTADRRTCTCCAGTGRAEIEGGFLEVERAKDMVSELEGIFQAHSGRAGRLLRRAA